MFSRLSRYRELLICIALTLLAQGLMPYLPLEYQRTAIINGQIWRLISGGWLHHNLPHMAMNLLALLLIWENLPSRLTPYWRPYLLALLVLCVDIGIWLWVPTTEYYWGLSGALHGLFAFGAWCWLPARPRLTILWLVGLAIKLCWDHWRTDDTTAALIGTAVHTPSHLIGSGAGIALGLLWWYWQRRAPHYSADK